MARYELIEGTSRKFWEITLRGKAFDVRFGRIGGDGQAQTKSFASPAEARAAHDKLVAEKTRKGYRLIAAGTAKRASPAPPSPSAEKGGGVDATCAAIEQYTERLLAAKIPGLDLRACSLAPQKATAIAAAEKKLGAPLPRDLVAFLARGLSYPSGSVDEPFAAMGFDFLDASKIAGHTAMLRKVADDTIEDEADEHASLIRRGVAVTYEEPELVVAPDGVYHFSYRNPVLKVASSWSAFLAAWLASGCFASHSFDSLWKKVKPHVTANVPPAKNPWLRAYKKQFPKS